MSNSCWWLSPRATLHKLPIKLANRRRQGCSPAPHGSSCKIQSKLLSWSLSFSGTTPLYWHVNAGSASWKAWIKWTPSSEVLQKPPLWQWALRVVKNSWLAVGSDCSSGESHCIRATKCHTLMCFHTRHAFEHYLVIANAQAIFLFVVKTTAEKQPVILFWPNQWPTDELAPSAMYTLTIKQ